MSMASRDTYDVAMRMMVGIDVVYNIVRSVQRIVSHYVTESGRRVANYSDESDGRYECCV